MKVKAGRGAGTMLAAGAVTTGAVLSGAAAGASAGAAVGGLLLLGPALAIGGVVRGVNNRAVSKKIEQRQTVLPIELAIDEELNLDIFFPLAPSPGKLEVVYADSNGEHLLVVDTKHRTARAAHRGRHEVRIRMDDDLRCRPLRSSSNILRSLPTH